MSELEVKEEAMLEEDAKAGETGEGRLGASPPNLHQGSTAPLDPTLMQVDTRAQVGGEAGGGSRSVDSEADSKALDPRPTPPSVVSDPFALQPLTLDPRPPSPSDAVDGFDSRRPSLRARIEALLFASPAPMKLLDLAQVLETSRPAVKRALDDVMAEWQARDGALAIVRQGPGYAIMLKSEYQDVAALLMPPELEPAELKTLSVLAVNQPIPQSRLVELRGSTAYEHVKALVEKGLVKRRRDGSTFVLRTTKLFATRFRVEDDPERIREALLALERKPAEPRIEAAGEGETISELSESATEPGTPPAGAEARAPEPSTGSLA